MCPGKGVTKRCRLSWLTNSALVYEPKCWGGGGELRVLSQLVQLYTGAQINFDDLTQYLTSGPVPEPHKGGGDNHNSYWQKLRFL
jgi:hypothetical protein